MKSRRPSASSTDFGLLAWLEDTRVALPLKGVECRFQIAGGVASVEVDQIFHQNANRPLDCTYTFPMPAGAAVYRCELHINGRVIRAKVEEKGHAKRLYLKQKEAGRRAALVESERENIFTLSLGNVQPDDVIVVRFAWFQVLDRAGDELRLLVPTCPGVRYIPGKPLLRALSGFGTADDTDRVSDASLITPPRIDALHPDAAYFSIEGGLSGFDVESGTVSSPSHQIFARERSKAVAIKLSGRGSIPDRDFVLVWREPKGKQLASQGWHWQEGGEAYALVEFRAPQNVKVAVDFPQDFYFLVDRSGSMAGVKWQRTCEALHAFIRLLGSTDRVWITLFESNYRDFSDAPMPAPEVLADGGFQRMETLGTAGGTELLPAAKHIMKTIAKHSAKQRTNIVLITDGQVGDDEGIARAFRRAAHVTIHTFGIDTAVNDAFLKSLAHRHRGGCWLQTPDDDIVGTIAGLGDRLRRPVLTELSVSDSWLTASGALPELHAGEVVTVALRGLPNSPVQIAARLPDGSNYQSDITLAPGNEAVKLLWARERIAALIETHPEEAIEVAKKHNLICKGAAFVAWDEEAQVAVAEEAIVQANLFPVVGMSRLCESRKVFFAPMSKVAALPMRTMRSPTRIRQLEGFLEAHEDDLGGDNVRELRTPPAPAFLYEVRDKLKRARVPQTVVENLMVWAGEDPDRIWERVTGLRETSGVIVRVRSNLRSQVLRKAFKFSLSQALAGSREAFLNQVLECLRIFNAARVIQELLIGKNVSQKVIEHLFAWTIKSGVVDSERLGVIRSFLESVDRAPFSARFEILQWEEFLERTLGQKHELTAAEFFR